MKPITLREIAEKLGVSRPAVSAALSEKRTTIHLSAALRARIRKAAETLGYRRNVVAESFIQRRSFLVGFLGRREYFLYAMDTLAGIEPVLDAAGLATLSFLHGNTAEEQERQLRRCLERRVDGLIVAGAPEDPGGILAARIEELRRRGVPLVQVYRKTFPRIPSVRVDDERIGWLQTRRLLELGHERIVHVTHDAYRAGTKEHLDARGRWEGYARAMREAGLKPAVETFPATRYFPLTGGRAAGARDVRIGGRYSAAACFNDYVALGVMDGLRALAYEDVAVLGYDDVEAAAAAGLSTFAPPMKALGRAAAEAVLAQIGGRKAVDVLLEPAYAGRSTDRPFDSRTEAGRNGR